MRQCTECDSLCSWRGLCIESATCRKNRDHHDHAPHQDREMLRRPDPRHAGPRSRFKGEFPHSPEFPATPERPSANSSGTPLLTGGHLARVHAEL